MNTVSASFEYKSEMRFLFLSHKLQMTTGTQRQTPLKRILKSILNFF